MSSKFYCCQYRKGIMSWKPKISLTISFLDKNIYFSLNNLIEKSCDDNLFIFKVVIWWNWSCFNRWHYSYSFITALLIYLIFGIVTDIQFYVYSISLYMLMYVNMKKFDKIHQKEKKVFCIFQQISSAGTF